MRTTVIGLTAEMRKAGTADAAERLCLPDVDQRALAGLKFSEALPERLATAAQPLAWPMPAPP